MKYVIFTERLKSNQINTLKKFTEVMIRGLIENDSIYIDDIGTFYTKKLDSASSYNPGYNDGASLYFMQNKVKNTKRFKELKNASKCKDIIKILTKLLKDNIILDIPDFGIFTSNDYDVKFTQNKAFKKKLNEEMNRKLNIVTDKTLSLISKEDKGLTQNSSDIVEYLNSDDEKNNTNNQTSLEKIKDYEDLEEVVYDDYVNKRDYTKLEDNKKLPQVKEEDIKASKEENKTENKTENTVAIKIEQKEKKEQQREIEDNTTRNMFKENIEKALDDSKPKKVSSKKFNAKILVVVSSIIIVAISSGIIIHFILENVRREASKIDVNKSVYSIVDSFFRTYKSTTLSMKLTQDMYLWEISEEVYDSPLYWPMIYGANVIVSNPAKKIPRGTIITYRDLRLKGNYFFNIVHRINFEQTLSKAYVTLYPIFLDHNENVHAIWALRLSSYFNSKTFKNYKNTINKDLYERVVEDTKNYAKRSI